MRMLQVEIFIGFLSSLSPFSSSLLHCLPSTLPLLSLSLSSLFLSRVWLGERFIQGLSWTIHRLSKWFLMMAKSFISRFKRLLWWRNVCVCLVTQSCLTLCNPMDCSPPGSSGNGDSPGKNTGVISMPSSRGSSQPRDWTQVSWIAGGFITYWTTREAPKYWSG